MMFVRLLMQTVVLALGQIWANKVRALLTTLGILIGVVAVSLTATATTGMESVVLKEFSTVGANKVWIFPRFPPNARDRYSWRQVRMSVQEVDGIRNSAPSLAAITPIMEMSTSVQFGQIYKDVVSVQAVRPSWHEIEQRFAIQGRQLSEIDEEQRLSVCIINDKAIGELGLDRNPIGQRILVGGRAFTIVGVVETKTVSPMFGGDEVRSEVYIPFRTGQMLRSEPRLYAVATTRNPEQYEDAKAEVRFYMRKARQLKPDDPDTFGVEAIEQFIEQFKKVAFVMTLAGMVIVAFSLAVGGVGIMNIMLASVSERTREIGLRKAVGARPAVILMQFLVEAVTLCLVGGFIGLFIAEAMVLIATLAFKNLSVVTIPTWAVAISIIFCAATGIVFGMIPAIKASRLDPIEALRHE
jgi:putative ABC transport system permease protein